MDGMVSPTMEESSGSSQQTNSSRDGASGDGTNANDTGVKSESSKGDAAADNRAVDTSGTVTLSGLVDYDSDSNSSSAVTNGEETAPASAPSDEKTLKGKDSVKSEEESQTPTSSGGDGTRSQEVDRHSPQPQPPTHDLGRDERTVTATEQVTKEKEKGEGERMEVDIPSPPVVKEEDEADCASKGEKKEVEGQKEAVVASAYKGEIRDREARKEAEVAETIKVEERGEEQEQEQGKKEKVVAGGEHSGAGDAMEVDTPAGGGDDGDDNSDADDLTVVTVPVVSEIKEELSMDDEPSTSGRAAGDERLKDADTGLDMGVDMELSSEGSSVGGGVSGTKTTTSDTKTGDGKGTSRKKTTRVTEADNEDLDMGVETVVEERERPGVMSSNSDSGNKAKKSDSGALSPDEPLKEENDSDASSDNTAHHIAAHKKKASASDSRVPDAVPAADLRLSIKDEPLDEAYDQALHPFTTVDIKDEPNTDFDPPKLSDEFKISAVYSVGETPATGLFYLLPRIPMNLPETPRQALQCKTDKLKNKLVTGHYKVVANTSSKVKSNVWKHFGYVSDGENNIVEGFAACKNCLKVFVHDSRNSGTSSLRKHAEVCAATNENASSSTMESFAKNSVVLQEPCKEDKDAVTKLCVGFVCNDIQPFEAVHGEGFLALAQGLINVGARAGRVDAKQLLPDPTTVSLGVTSYAEEVRRQTLRELKMQLSKGNGAITLDMWTDDHSKTAYLCVTLHYIDNKWKLIERVLCTSEWDSSLRETTYIKPAIISALQRFGISEYYFKLIYVTDRGTDIVAALGSVTRLSCAAHILNTVLSTTFNRNSLEEDAYGQELTTLIDAAKSLVTYFKHSKLQTRLKKPLEASVEMCWNSLHAMLESISCQYNEIRALLQVRGEVGRLDSLEEVALTDSVEFLGRFKEATKALEALETPTLHLTIVWFERIRRHLCHSSTDSKAISSLKEKCLAILQEKFEVHPLHRLAMFVHPKLKSLKLIADSDEVANVHSEMRRLVKDIKDKRESLERCRIRPPLEKRPRVSADTLSDVEDSGDEAPQYQDEVTAYIDFKTPKDDSFDVLTWWSEHERLFPNIAQIARSVLAIPATAAASKQDFLCAGYVIPERSSQLRQSTVDDILFLHSNLKHHTKHHL